MSGRDFKVLAGKCLNKLNDKIGFETLLAKIWVGSNTCIGKSATFVTYSDLEIVKFKASNKNIIWPNGSTQWPQTFIVIVSGTATPEHSMSLIMSTTLCSSSGSSMVSPPDSGMIFQPFRPPSEGRIVKLSS